MIATAKAGAIDMARFFAVSFASFAMTALLIVGSSAQGPSLIG